MFFVLLLLSLFMFFILLLLSLFLLLFLYQHSDRHLFYALLTDHTNLNVAHNKKTLLAITENPDHHLGRLPPRPPQPPQSQLGKEGHRALPPDAKGSSSSGHRPHGAGELPVAQARRVPGAR